MMDVTKIQGLLQAQGLDGWLFHDFHGRDPITRDILGLDGKSHPSRRLFYFIPAGGEPVKDWYGQLAAEGRNRGSPSGGGCASA